MEAEWEDHLKRAMLLVRNLRADELKQNIDARAIRVALKYALLVDTYFARKKTSPEEEKALDTIALKFFQESKHRASMGLD
jgi:hypothetical protein